MNTNWAKILLFSLLGFALGFVICCLLCGRCSRGGSCHGDSCGKEQSCHGGASGCSHHGSDEKGACCKRGGHGTDHGDAHVKEIVHGLEAANFQGDTTIAIHGGTVNVSRTGDSTMVKVEMTRTEDAHTGHAH